MIVDGRRWPELFWEGKSVRLGLPAQPDVSAEEDIAEYLRLALTAQGIEGRELDGFLEAWLPDLQDQGPMRIGFHSQANIEALAPLDITPQPDTLIRVLMDAVPADAAAYVSKRKKRLAPSSTLSPIAAMSSSEAEASMAAASYEDASLRLSPPLSRPLSRPLSAVDEASCAGS